MNKILLASTILLLLIACNKTGSKHPCYNAALVHKRGCTTDCPGFVGCDGKTYCNECEAARAGIGPK